jgi:CRISPR-associated DxTHG motif protein
MWKEVHYKIKDREYTSSCSSIALALDFSRKYSHVTLFFQALDSIICSDIMGDGSGLKSGPELKNSIITDRKNIESTLKKYFEGILEKTAENGAIAIVKDNDNLIINGGTILNIRVAVSPAAGEYSVRRSNAEITTINFNGDPTAVFAKIFNEASSIINNRKSPPDICLDLTHGVNYLQAMAIYAIEMLHSLYKTKVQVVNFSPYQAGGLTKRESSAGIQKSSPSQGSAQDEKPTLVEFDVSKLVDISKLASSLSNLILDEADVQTIKESIESVRSKMLDFSRNVALAWYYMSTGIVTMAYYHLCKAREKVGQVENYLVDKNDYGLVVNVSDSKAVVEYTERYDWRSAMPLIVWSMYNRLMSFFKQDNISQMNVSVTFKNLKDAIDRMAEERTIYSPTKVILEAEMGSISERYKTIKNSVQELSEENPLLKSLIPKYPNGGEFPRDNEVLRSLIRSSVSPTMIEELLKEASGSTREELCEKIRENLKHRGRLLHLLSEQEPKKRDRNMISHAGLTYEPIQNIIIDEEDEENKFNIDGNRYYNALLVLDPGKLDDDPFEAWSKKEKAAFKPVYKTVSQIQAQAVSFK